MEAKRSTRSVLQRQLEVEWSFAQDLVLKRFDEELAVWKPTTGNVVTVHQTSKGWRADWPDEQLVPIPSPTIGWLMWHIEWWWVATISCIQGNGDISPDEHLWTGSTEQLIVLKRSWDHLLAEGDLDEFVSWFTPDKRPFSEVAAWVNFELAKNLAEINVLINLRANTMT